MSADKLPERLAIPSHGLSEWITDEHGIELLRCRDPWGNPNIPLAQELARRWNAIALLRDRTAALEKENEKLKAIADAAKVLFSTGPSPNMEQFSKASIRLHVALAEISNPCVACNGSGWIWNRETQWVGEINVQRPCPKCRPDEARHNPKPM